jgi:hypothetical protein
LETENGYFYSHKSFKKQFLFEHFNPPTQTSIPLTKDISQESLQVEKIRDHEILENLVLL